MLFLMVGLPAAGETTLGRELAALPASPVKLPAGATPAGIVVS